MSNRRITPSTLYYGDCLDIMDQWEDEQVDLIYLDPPFNSNANYNILFGSENPGRSQIMAFSDTWSWDGDAADRVAALKAMKISEIWSAMEGLESILGPSGMLAYLSYMADRLLACKRLLKPSGAIYLHCDPAASHYLKVVMDAIFQRENFRNEIIWFYHDSPGRTDRYFPRKHDVIFWYTRNDAGWQFHGNDVRVPILAASRQRYKSVRKIGGKEYLGGTSAKTGKIPEDVWSIPVVKRNSAESQGYPTQKPLALLDRIIRASSSESDLVLDPFCGCGTTVVAAEKLNRRWAGIDISAFAVETVMRERLLGYGVNVHTEGIPMDMESAKLLADSDPFKFEKWAVNQVPGLAPNAIQVRDGGVDGRGTLLNKTGEKRDNVVAQVKAGRVTLDNVKAFIRTMETEKAACGVFITLMQSDITKGMRKEANRLGDFTIEDSAGVFPVLQFWNMEEWFAHDKDRRFLPNFPPLRNPFGRERPRTLYEQEK